MCLRRCCFRLLRSHADGESFHGSDDRGEGNIQPFRDQSQLQETHALDFATLDAAEVVHEFVNGDTRGLRPECAPRYIARLLVPLKPCEHDW